MTAVPSLQPRRAPCAVALGLFAGVLAVFCLAPSSVWGQVSREYDIKAAYLYQFGRYFEYPASAFADAKAPFVIAVVGSAQIEELLTTATRGKLLQNRPIVIRRFERFEDVSPCHILYVSDRVDDKLEGQINAKFADSPVVLVGEGEGYIPKGGTVAFLLVENKVKIRVSRKSSQRAGLKPSSKLLQVAEVVD